MPIWLEILCWFGVGIASGFALAILFKVARLELASLGQLLILMTAMAVFSTGVARMLSDWSLPICILAGLVLALPMYWLLMVPVVLVMLLVDVYQRTREKN